MSEKTKHDKRLAVLMYPAVQRRIAELARIHTLNQSEVIEVMLDVLNSLTAEHVEALMRAKRESKIATRTSKTALLKSLAKLTAAQLEELAKLAETKA
jgi:urate oxidase